MSHRKRTKILAAGPHNEFADATAGIGDALRILWSESLVIVVMAVDDHVRVGCVKGIPQRFHNQVVAVRAAGTEKWLVKIGQRAGYGMRREIFAQPFALHGSRVASTHRYALTIQDFDVPSAEFIAVVAFARIASGLAEILEVEGSSSGMEFVIADCRTGAVFRAPPGFVIALEIRRGPVRVSEIADGHYSAGNFVEQLCGRFGSRKVSAIGDVACANQNGSGFRFVRYSSRCTALHLSEAEQSYED